MTEQGTNPEPTVYKTSNKDIPQSKEATAMREAPKQPEESMTVEKAIAIMANEIQSLKQQNQNLQEQVYSRNIRPGNERPETEKLPPLSPETFMLHLKSGLTNMLSNPDALKLLGKVAEAGIEGIKSWQKQSSEIDPDVWKEVYVSHIRSQANIMKFNAESLSLDNALKRKRLAEEY